MGVNVDNDWAVRLASKRGKLETVKYLISQGANIRARNNCALRSARDNGHTEVVKYIESLGVYQVSRSLGV